MAYVDQLFDGTNDLLDSSSNELLDSTRRSSASAYIEGGTTGTLTTTSQDAFLAGTADTSASQSAYLAGSIDALDAQDAYIEGIVRTSTDAFIHGSVDTSISTDAFLAGSTDTTDSTSAFTDGFGPTSIHAFLKGKAQWKHAYLLGAKEIQVDVAWITVTLKPDGEWTFTHAYLEGVRRTSNPAFVWGWIDTKTSQAAWLASAFKRGWNHAFLHGTADGNDSQSAYIEGVDRSSTPAYIQGIGYPDTSAHAYTEGVVRSGTSAFISTTPHISVFTSGLKNINTHLYTQYVYLGGWAHSNSSRSAYLLGGEATNDSVLAYCEGTNNVIASAPSYIEGVTRISVPAYMSGVYVSKDYIVLEDSSGQAYKYRVLQEGYSNGSIQDGSTINRTIGGGTDIHSGKKYKVWEPLIKARHTEELSGYGTIQDLETLYEYVNLTGSPNRVITFYDHFQIRHEVLMMGDLQKRMVLLQVEGIRSWMHIRLLLVEI